MPPRSRKEESTPRAEEAPTAHAPGEESMFEQPETPSQPASSTASEDVPTTTVTPPLKTVEEWAAEKKTKPHLFAAARAAYNWPVGRELRGEEYDKAITSISTARIGYSRKKV